MAHVCMYCGQECYAGRHNEELPECSFFCNMAEQEIANG